MWILWNIKLAPAIGLTSLQEMRQVRGGRQSSNGKKTALAPTIYSVSFRAQLGTLPQELSEALRTNSNLLSRTLSLGPLLHAVPPTVQSHWLTYNFLNSEAYPPNTPLLVPSTLPLTFYISHLFLNILAATFLYTSPCTPKDSRTCFCLSSHLTLSLRWLSFSLSQLVCELLVCFSSVQYQA